MQFPTAPELMLTVKMRKTTLRYVEDMKKSWMSKAGFMGQMSHEGSPTSGSPSPSQGRALASKGKKVKGLGGNTEFQQAQSSQSAVQSGEAAFAVKQQARPSRTK